MNEQWRNYWTSYLYTNSVSHGPATLMFFDPIQFIEELHANCICKSCTR